MKKITTLRQAILALPELDKRWRISDDGQRACFHKTPRSKFSCVMFMDGIQPIDNYVAAAHTVGMEIEYHSYWKPQWFNRNGKCIGYTASFTTSPVHVNLEGTHKTPAAAINAAFIAAMQYRKEHK